LNLLLQGDVVLLKGLVHDAVVDTLGSGQGAWGLAIYNAWLPGTTEVTANMLSPTVSSSLAGVYGAVRNVTMIPYQGIISLTFVVFPVVSAATFKGDTEQTSRVIQGSVRFAILLVCMLCGGLVLTEDFLLRLLFGSPYSIGAAFLLPMVAGTLTFAVYVVLTSALTAAGFPGAVLVVGILSSLTHLGLVIGAAQIDAVPFVRADYIAWASALGPLLGFVLAAFIIRRRLGVNLPWLSLLRALGAAVLATGFARWLVDLDTVVDLALRLLLFLFLILGVLKITGEVGRDEVQQVLRLFGKKVRE